MYKKTVENTSKKMNFEIKYYNKINMILIFLLYIEKI